jgi:hypothetical protein
MGNTVLTPSIIAKEALMQLENELVMGGLVYRAYDATFNARSEGHKIGDTITIKKPVRYEVTDGATLNTQDTIEGSVAVVLNKRKHVGLEFSSQDLTLKIGEISDIYIKPAMSQIANTIDMDLMDLYKTVPNWVGTPGQTINSFADFGLMPERLDEFAVPVRDRHAVLSPSDNWGMLGNVTTLFANSGKSAESALREASLGRIGNMNTYQAQNVKTHFRGTVDNTTPLVRGASQSRTYGGGAVATDYVSGSLVAGAALVKDAPGTSQTLSTDGWDASTTIKAGDIFTIAGVYAVNPVSKQVLPFLRQFVVLADVTTNASAAADSPLTITPAIITSGAYQTVDVVPADDAVITILGTASTGYRQNLAFHKNAFALAMVPLEMPPASVGGARETYKGLSLRIVPIYDGINDVSKWRIDCLYGVKSIYPELAVRGSGSA